MNLPRYSHSITILNEAIYAIGGKGERGERLKSVEKYSVTDGWKSINGMIKPRSNAGAVGLNGKLYVIGGYEDRNPTNSVECYDPATGRWTRCANLNEPHGCPTVTLHNGQIYVLGGHSGNEVNRYGNIWGTKYSSAVERYDPQRNEWTKICSLSAARDGIGCISLNNQLWTVGGYDSVTVAVYDEDNAWIYKQPIYLSGSYYCFTVPEELFESECKN